MKYYFILAIIMASFTTFAQNDPTIMTVDGENVSLSEFEQIFWKNKKENETNKEELDEYVDLFTKFKLKVKAAEADGLDTTKKFLSEFGGYKTQLQKPYLIDTTTNEALIEEAYQRTVNEIRASHLLLLVKPDASPKDTLEAYKKISEIRAKIIQGKITFEKAAIKYSEDESVKVNKGDLGYFSAFRMVYPFEDAAYKTNIGSVSEPFRTQFGYHLVNPTATRKSRGKVKVAHIMVRVKKDATAQEKENAKKKIDEIYAKLSNGEDFGALVRDFSDDRNSVRKNGELEWVEAGRYFPEFEDAAYKLENDGDFSAPISTPAGLHILKRIQFKAIDNKETLRTELKNKIQRDPQRAQKTKNSFVNKLKKEYAFMETKANFRELALNINTKDLKSGKWTGAEVADLNKELFSFAGKSYTQKDFTNYLIELKSFPRGLSKSEYLDREYERYTANNLINFERSQLESKYPKYKSLLKEYRDGILLFEINDQKVWSYAVKDTAGLKKFYEANKQDYMWEDRVDARIFTSTNKKVIKKAYKLVKKGKIKSDSIVNYLNRDSQLNINLESGRFETANHEALKGKTYKDGVNKPQLEGSKYVMVAIDNRLPKSPKKLSESRGAFTAGYQEYLENEWIEELKAKYKVTIDKDVLYSIKKKPNH